MKNAVFFLLLAGLIVSLFFLRPRLSKNPSLEEIESFIHKLTVANSPPGLSVTIVKGGDRVYEMAFGMADGPAEIPAAPGTVYHWWSMTKVATAIAVLQLHEDGLLELDAPVVDYLPFFQVELDGVQPLITVRQLLRHTSGLADPMPTMIGWVHYESTAYNQTDLVKQHLPDYNQLKFTPDTKTAYSNLGYMVLGAVIEAVSGQRYEEYVRTHILQLLDMTGTDFYYTDQMIGRAAVGSHPLMSIYTPLLPSLLDLHALVRERQGAIYWFNPVYLDATPPSGLIGPPGDAANLAAALLSKTAILSPESHAFLIPEGEVPAMRPLGWAEFNLSGRPWVQHRGGGPGFATIMRLYPQEDLGIILMANNTNLPAEKLVDAFAGLDWH